MAYGSRNKQLLVLAVFVLVLRPVLFWPVLVIVIEQKDQHALTTPQICLELGLL